MRTTGIAAVILVLAANAQSEEKPSSKSVKDVLDNATTFELYSLDPEKEEEKGFHGHAVLGKTVVRDADVRKEVVASLYRAIADSEGNPARCFVPRHGIRATHKGKTVDVVICFQCYRVKFFVKDQEETETLTRLPEALFDKVLKKAGVPLAPKAGK